ncbi:PIN domain-containing protein [Cesiribacter sp. SM1]|uniref:PIN domain-containing protein n=1 Tax=Cesiribacter sp. SM1 TaxID=2861196 RepID=UPI001CD65623|nr:PIN domain-containing protein [Cesiribacter sp. SM1]
MDIFPRYIQARSARLKPLLTLSSQISVGKKINHFFTHKVKVHGHDEFIQENMIELMRKYKLKLPDAVVAATAILYQFPLLTSDTGFEKINCAGFELILYDAPVWLSSSGAGNI